MVTENLHCDYVIQLKANQTNLNKLIRNELDSADTWLVENTTTSTLIIEEAISTIETENITASTLIIEEAISTTETENITDLTLIIEEAISTIETENTTASTLMTERATPPTSKDTYELSEKNHGRHSFWKTSVYAASNIKDTKQILSLWSGIKTIICVQRIVIHTDLKNKKKDYNSRAYYISNRTDLTAKEFHEGIRGHWGIENGLHYEKDVVLNEDKNRIENKSSAVIFSTFNTFAINFLRMLGFKGIKDATIIFGFNFKELVF